MKRVNMGIAGAAVCMVLFLILSIINQPSKTAEANIALGGEYGPVGIGYSTTTSPLHNNPAQFSLIRAGRGYFGSIAIREAGAAGGDLEFYDATTTDRNLRTGNLATSSIFLGSIPNDAAVGDYRFDMALNYGLLMVKTGAEAVATSTITVR